MVNVIKYLVVSSILVYCALGALYMTLDYYAVKNGMIPASWESCGVNK